VLTDAEFSTALGAMGVPVTWTQVKPPQASVNVKSITGTIDNRNEVLVNAYGVGGRTFQFRAQDLPTPPVKFDQIVLAGETYTIHDVNTYHERGSGNVIAYRCLCKGR